MVKKCPKCGGKVEQVISAPAVQFKGSGWYVTDYAKKSGSGSSSKPEAKSETKSDSDSKSDSGKDSAAKKETKAKPSGSAKS